MPTQSSAVMYRTYHPVDLSPKLSDWRARQSVCSSRALEYCAISWGIGRVGSTASCHKKESVIFEFIEPSQILGPLSRGLIDFKG